MTHYRKPPQATPRPSERAIDAALRDEQRAAARLLDVRAWIESGECPWVTRDEWSRLDARGQWTIVDYLSDLLTLEPRREVHEALARECGRG